VLPSTEHPEVFGQHPNADIASQIAETRTLFDTLLSLQPQVTSTPTTGARPSREDMVRMWRVDPQFITGDAGNVPLFFFLDCSMNQEEETTP